MNLNIETWFNTAEVKRFFFPGKIFSGVGAFSMAIDLCQQNEAKTLVVVDRNLYQLAFVKEQLKRLDKCLINVVLVNGTPYTQDVYEAVQSQAVRPTHILAIGGGSTVDFAKAMLAIFHFGKIEDLGLHGKVAVPSGDIKPLLVAVPTTAGSGAEASRYFVTYDKSNKHKVFGKNWGLIADWIMLDPVFLESMPIEGIVACGFDAFVHLFESLICRYEKSSMGEMFSLYGISAIIKSLDSIVYKNQKNNENFIILMEMATLGGVALTNVRTGNIHEAAGALLEVTNLSHPETLFVFFKKGMMQYQHQIRDQEQKLISFINDNMQSKSISSLSELIDWWEKLFDHAGIASRVALEIKRIEPDLHHIRDHIFQRIWDDKVWVEKESPLTLNEKLIYDLIDQSMTQQLQRADIA
jgi:alcohol dehydrogenase class IV